jgi:hypothetical protein
MDANPWLYAVMGKELLREGKIVAGAPPGNGTIPDPRRFVYLEACGEVGNAALAFAVRIGSEWIASDRGVRQYRIVRDGCFRAAIPLPAAAGVRDIRALRALAFERPPAEGLAPAPAGPVRLTRINRLFMLDEAFMPGPSMLNWSGPRTIVSNGSPLEVPIAWKR